MMTLVELIGPNIALNKFMLTKIGITNKVVPFVHTTIYANKNLYSSLGLKFRDFSLRELNLGVLSSASQGRSGKISNPSFSVFYLENITDDQIKRLLELKYGDKIRNLDELKMELL